jgi:hypothetical protein
VNVSHHLLTVFSSPPMHRGIAGQRHERSAGETEMERDYGTGRRRLPGYADWTAGAESVRDARASRDAGVRRVRKMSNWTAAALVAGVAVTSGYFAHAATVATQAPGYSGTAGQGQPGTAPTGHNGHKATLTHPVVTSGGSGVTAGSGGAGGSNGSGWRDS